ncbi:MAG: hypothetical protein AB1810_00585 [Pseudomonadota bacterium]
MRMPLVLPLLAASGLVLHLSGCGSLPALQDTSPQKVGFGQEAHLNLRFDQASEVVSVALRASGPPEIIPGEADRKRYAQLLGGGRAECLKDVGFPFKVQASVVWEGYCYLAAGGEGLRVYQTGQLSAPTEVARFHVAGDIADLAVANGKLYLAGELGLSVVDISIPAKPRWLGSNNKFGPGTRLAVSERYALVESYGHWAVLDVSRAERPVWLGGIPPKATVTAAAVEGDMAILGTADGITVYDLAGATMPALNHSGLNLGGSRRVEYRDETLYVADWFSGLHRYEVHDPRRVKHRDNLHTPGSAKGVLLDDQGIIYLGDDDHGLQVIDPRTLRIRANLATPGLSYGMELVGRRLYLADHRGGFHIIDVHDPQRPVILGSYDTPGKAWAVKVFEQHAYVADDSSGVLIFDVSDPANPLPVGAFNPGGQAEDILISGRLAYAAFYDDGVYILDIRDPRLPVVIGHVATPGNARGLYLDDDLLYLADWEAGLQVIDVSDPRAPRWLSGIDTPGAAWGVTVQGDYAYVMDWWGGVLVVDVRDKRHLKIVSRYQAGAFLSDVAVQGPYGYALGANGAFHVYDANNPEGPIWMTSVEISGRPAQMAIVGTDAYVAAGQGSLVLIDIRDPFQARLAAAYFQVGEVKAVAAVPGKAFTVSPAGQLGIWSIDEKKNCTSLGVIAGRYRAVAAEAERLAALTEEGQLAVFEAGGEPFPELVRRRGDQPYDRVAMAGGRIVAAAESGVLDVYAGNKLVKQASLRLPDGIRDIALKDDALYVSHQGMGVIVYDIAQLEVPALRHVYRGALPAGPIAAGEQVILGGGQPFLASAAVSPAVSLKKSPAALELTLPAGLALGFYDLIVQTKDGRLMEYPRLLEVAMPAGKRSTYSMEDLQKALKEQRPLPTQAP